MTLLEKMNSEVIFYILRRNLCHIQKLREPIIPSFISISETHFVCDTFLGTGNTTRAEKPQSLLSLPSDSEIMLSKITHTHILNTTLEENEARQEDSL